MLRWVRVKDVGDTEFLLEDMVDRFRFQDENERVVAEDGTPASMEPLLLGITKHRCQPSRSSRPRRSRRLLEC